MLDELLFQLFLGKGLMKSEDGLVLNFVLSPTCYLLLDLLNCECCTVVFLFGLIQVKYH